jgi:hypothetical protein
MGEKSSPPKGLISRIYKELKKVNSRRMMQLMNGQTGIPL